MVDFSKDLGDNYPFANKQADTTGGTEELIAAQSASIQAQADSINARNAGNAASGLGSIFKIAEEASKKTNSQGIDLNKNPILSAARDEFALLKGLKDQGRSSSASVGLRAEAALKKYINQAPALAPELRNLARTEVAFDPLGQSLGISLPKAKQASPIETLAQQYNLSMPDASKIYRDAVFAEQKNTFTLGRMIDGEIPFAVNGDLSEDAKDLLHSSVASSIKQGIAPILNGRTTLSEEDNLAMATNLQTSLTQLKSKLMETFNVKQSVTGIPVSDAEKNLAMEKINEAYDPLIQFVKSGGMAELNNTSLSKLSGRELVFAMNDVANVSKAITMSDANPQFVGAYVDNSVKLSRTAEELKKPQNAIKASAIDVKKIQEENINTLQDIKTGTVRKGSDAQQQMAIVNNAINYMTSSKLSDQERLNAFRLLQANMPEGKVLAAFDNVDTEAAVRSNAMIKEQFRNQFASDEAATLLRLRENMATLEKEGYTFHVEDGTIKGAYQGGKGLTRDIMQQVSGTERLVARGITDELPKLIKIAQRYYDVLGFKSPKEYEEDVYKQLLTNKEAGQSTNPK